MKKVIIGLAVLGIFVIYSIGIRHKAPVLSKPSSLVGATPKNNSSSGGSSSGGSGSSGSSSGSGSGSGSGSSSNSGQYKDGTFTGNSENAYWGNVQVSAKITGGKIKSVSFLQYPNSHSTSVIINQQAMPYLKQEAVQAQSANVQIISGATFTSQAFIQSLSSALSQAKA